MKRSKSKTKILIRRAFYFTRRHFPLIRNVIDIAKTELLHRRDKRAIAKSGLFDAEFYKRKNLDVKAAKVNPLDHYLYNGGFEGRDPHPQFDSKAYMASNPDVVAYKINPLLHYVRYGKKEGRSAFPAGSFVGKSNGRRQNLVDCFQNLGRAGACITLPAVPDCSIIVPVYGGYKHLLRLLPVLGQQTESRHKILFVDDCNSDVNIIKLLDEFVGKRSNSMVLRNESNIGFVGSVNRAVGEVQTHFIILNTDTEVVPGWVDRLFAPMVADAKIASVTPFTNAGTIFSFPVPMDDNPTLTDQFLPGDIDRAFRGMSAGNTDFSAPTGVGFCMAVNLDVWKEIGGFDAVAFKRGYGEETDWCQRALSKGYRHVAAHDLFIYHFHGGSFPSAEKAERISAATQILIDRWPDYPQIAGRQIVDDPWKTYRDQIFLRLALLSRPVVIIDHAMGGGANDYRAQEAARLVAAGRVVVLISYDVTSSTYLVDCRTAAYNVDFSTRDVAIIFKMLVAIEKGEIIYNNAVSWDCAIQLLEFINKWISAERSLTILIHDYFPVCSSYTLINYKNEYCGVPKDLRECNFCLKRNANAAIIFNMTEWRGTWQGIFDKCSNILCFSKSSVDILNRAYRIDPRKVEVRPHRPLLEFRPEHWPDMVPHRLVVGVVGGVSLQKGAQVIADLLKMFKARDISARIVVIGEMDQRFLKEGTEKLQVHGPYQRAELPALLHDYEVNLCLMPSIWPETFSYVTQELIAMDMPIVCFPIGAPAERIGSYGKGAVAKDMTAASLWEAVEVLSARLSAEPFGLEAGE